MIRMLSIVTMTALALHAACAAPHAAFAPDRPDAMRSASAAGQNTDDELIGTYTQTRPGVSAIQHLTLVLDPDRTYTLTTEPVGGRGMPIIDRGAWSSEDGTVTLHLTTSGAQRVPSAIVLERQQGRLVATSWDRGRWGSADLRLDRAESANLESAPAFAGTYKGHLEGPDFREKFTLVLKPDGRCAMTVTLVGSGEPPLIAEGMWRSSGRSVTVRLPYSYPKNVIAVPFITFYLGSGHAQTEMVFARTGRELIAIEYDRHIWGAGDLRLRKE